VAAARVTPATVDEYISAFPAEIRSILQEVRATIRSAAPEAVEKISYGMPTFALDREIVHFAAFKRHIGLFPPVRDPELLEATIQYRGEKGNLRFPLDQPMPLALIGRIVEARLREISQPSKDAERRAASPASQAPTADTAAGRRRS
jgi:uncharacterized protein YdhG (YjbR/CyaY superfamily)